MKNSLILSLALSTIFYACNKIEDTNSVKPKAAKRNIEAGAKRACGNTIQYSFMKPDFSYGYSGGNGCLSYYTGRYGTAVSSRTFKARVTNTSQIPQDIELVMGTGNANLAITVNSVTGGTFSLVQPSQWQNDWHWVINQATPLTAYELTYTVYSLNSSAIETNAWLRLEKPCVVPRTDDCDSDTEMHFVSLPLDYQSPF